MNTLKEAYSELPAEILRNGRFCCWQYEERNGKRTKVPYSPVDGGRARSNDISCFGSFEQTVQSMRQASFEGIGIGIFCGICAIDLDHCLDEEGHLTGTAQKVMDLMHSYTEISPGGDGLHILFKADEQVYDQQKYYIMNRNLGIESYVAGVTNKYVTVTGKAFQYRDAFGDRTKELQQFLDAFMARPTEKRNEDKAAGNAINAENNLAEEEILEMACNCRSGPAFSELWNGNIGSYASHSEADMALCSHLAFWTGCDAGMMDRMFRRSGLMRPKWDSRRHGSTYGAITIQHAISSCQEIYTPKRKNELSREVTKKGSEAVEEEKTDQPGHFHELIPLKPEASNLPEFPVECLPDVMKAYVLAVAEHSQTSPDMAAAVGLGVLASCLQGKFQVEGTPGYTEQLSLYVTVIAPPGERKSSVLRDMTHCIEDYEQQANEKLEPCIKANKKERDAIQRRISMLEKKLEKKPDPSAESELITLQDRLDELPEIKKIRYSADDCSIEALTSLLANNNGRMTVISAEGGIFDIMSGRYSNKPNLDVWLKGHCGDTIRVDRLGREAEYIPHPALTAILSIQPVVVNEIMENPAMTGRGLIARFLYASPPSRIGSRIFCTDPIPEEVGDAYQELIFRLMDLSYTEEAKTIRLSKEAREIISGYFMEHEKFLLGEGQEIADWANKYIGSILRISALLHIAQFDPEEMEISADTMKKAIEIGKYFLAHVRYAYALMGNDISLKKANFVLGKIKKNGFESVKRSDLFQVCRGKFYKKTEELLATLELLEAHGYIRQEQPVYTGTGRPPDVMVIVNKEALQ